MTITAYGEGDVCDQEGQHTCLKVGQQKAVCISDQLVCDGVQNCPSGKEFESDENPAECELRKKMSGPEKWLKDFVHTALTKLRQGINSTATQEHHATTFTVTRSDNNKTIVVETVIDTTSNIRKNFPKGLAKYGPWGYLMLGMLLCGGALLVCGLWGE